SSLSARTISHFIPATFGSFRVAHTVPMTRPSSMDFSQGSGYSNARVHQVKKALAEGSFGSEVAIVARASAFALACFCVLEVALPRAGRAAAALLLKTDSSALRWLEEAGARVQGFTAAGIWWSAWATIATALLARIATQRALARVATIVILGAAIG